MCSAHARVSYTFQHTNTACAFAAVLWSWIKESLTCCHVFIFSLPLFLFFIFFWMLFRTQLVGVASKIVQIVYNALADLWTSPFFYVSLCIWAVFVVGFLGSFYRNRGVLLMVLIIAFSSFAVCQSHARAVNKKNVLLLSFFCNFSSPPGCHFPSC